MHRSPGVFFDHDKGKHILLVKILYAARIIPYRGSWLDFEFDAKDILNARIDRKKKFPATTVLYSLGFDSQEILSCFIRQKFIKDKKMDEKPFISDNLKGSKAVYDLVDAKNNKVIIETGKKSPKERLIKIIKLKIYISLMMKYRKIYFRRHCQF